MKLLSICTLAALAALPLVAATARADDAKAIRIQVGKPTDRNLQKFQDVLLKETSKLPAQPTAVNPNAPGGPGAGGTRREDSKAPASSEAVKGSLQQLDR